MSSFTTIGRGHGAPCQPATERAWNAARQDPQLAQLCQQIESCTDPDEQKRLKDRLPVWTPRCGEFRNNHRSQSDAICHLNRQMFDIDQKGHTESILGLMIKDEKIGEMFIGSFLILMVEESVRRGTHVLVVPPSGLSLNDAQALFSQLINLPVDPAVKNVAGCIYMVPEDHVRYQSPKFFKPEVVNGVMPPLQGFGGGNNPQGSANALPSAMSPFQGSASPNGAKYPSTGCEPCGYGTFNPDGSPVSGDIVQYPTDYDGIPYTLLVDCLAEQLGGVPVHGSRNNFLFSMACHLRYVCNDDPQWIARVLPTYGEDRDRVFRTIQSACNRAQSRNMPAMVQRAISVARGQYNLSNTSNSSNLSNPLAASVPPELPKKLPKLKQLLVSKVDPMYRPAVAMAVFPPLGAHLHGVTTRYIDNSENDLGGFMSVCMAKQSIGKGSVNMPIELVMEDVRQRDSFSRDQEKQWKQQCKSAKSSEKKPARPEGLCVQYLMSNMTNAAMVQRLIDAQQAGDKFLYVKLDEIELLDQIKATGGATASEIIRLAFTQSLYGQERVGQDSITGTPPLRFNFNASTTIPGGMQYFRNGLTNGTLSRVTFSTIIKPMGRRGIPRFGDYDESFRRALQPFITNLNAASGLIECRQAERMANQLMDENYDLAELSDDDIFETLSYRANRIAYDKAMLLFIAHGYQWSKEIADFCRWSEQYDLWCKLHFFGQTMREQIQVEALPTVFGPQNMLDLLPDRFSRQDLQAVHRAQGKDGNVMQLIYNWTFRKYIEQDETTGEYIKTNVYLSKHKSVLS